ncbi:MAG: conjugal transfer protein TraX [Lachnospiraceae bacterium]|nr:conjugal transfer protein TraX [Lachnospiraceae bacterium]
MPEKKWGLSGSTLKWIAVVSMLIDHLGLGLAGRILITNCFGMSREQWQSLYILYRIMRGIGRMAFPIYCFLLVEGFKWTHSALKYALRLGIFAIASEIPFDLAFSGTVLEFGYQNVFFTLLCGFLAMFGADWLTQKLLDEKPLYMQYIGALLITVLCTAPMAGVAELLRTDYGAKGVVCIMLLYLFRYLKWEQVAVGAISFLWEKPASLAFIAVALYNGKRGMRLKYFFYLFYPLHLLLIYFICMMLGIAGQSVI